MIREAMTEVAKDITDLGLDADVCTSPLDASNALANGRCTVVVPPPALTGLTLTTTEFEFKTIVASPYQDLERDTDELEVLLDQLMHSQLSPTTAEPNVFQAFDGQSYACYVLTHTTYSD